MNCSRFALLLGSTLLLAGCATTANYNNLLSSWNGYPIQDFISKWGPADNSFIGPDGNRIYVYSQRNVTYFNTSSATSPIYGGQFANQAYVTQCTTWLEVDKNNKIIHTMYKGNNCIATQDEYKTKGNPYNPPLLPVKS